MLEHTLLPLQSSLRALALRNAKAILFYNSKNHFIIYTILFYNSFTSQTSIFIKILFFNLSLLLFFLTETFAFLGFPTVFFFLSFSLNTGSTQNAFLFLPQHLCDTHRPIRTKTQKNPSHHCPLLTKIPAEQKPILKKKKKPSVTTEGKKKPIRQSQQSYQQSRFETHAVENTQKSSPAPPSELPMINPNDPPTDKRIHHFKPTDQPIQTHHQPIPAQRSKPSSPIHADPTSNLKNPKRNTDAMREKPCDER